MAEGGVRSKIGVISAFHSHSLALTIAAKKMAATTVCRPSFLVPSFPTPAQLVKLALNNGVSFCALSRRHRSIPPVRQALGGRGGGPPTHLLACMRPLKVPYGCVQQSALQHRGRDGGRRDGREAGLGQVGTIRVRPYINILGSLC